MPLVHDARGADRAIWCRPLQGAPDRAAGHMIATPRAGSRGMRRGLAALKSYLWCARLCGLSEKRLRAFDGAEKRSETRFWTSINIGTRVLVHFSRCRVTRLLLVQDARPLFSAHEPD